MSEYLLLVFSLNIAKIFISGYAWTTKELINWKSFKFIYSKNELFGSTK